ncbi:dual specificity phosphatase DUPD1 isoform X1 [Electrophorus electricus]|uniref:dual specificity phosphatase DUPD1 isoform X1 n=1 Tax=Electrophorus electricus TaxID=8005 RepID=UPI0015D064B3|nr:dual specificity phosphatase DUPD1 isoform X1 [Electrophorus electricus]XP_026887511.2 dual specificity phosphatase DUPD1 isoform X1 [Electrophorus electricus]XP_035389234.1 dual specificity phosphatase DUPD1 isoform X1 [Electrophorus electricus]
MSWCGVSYGEKAEAPEEQEEYTTPSNYALEKQLSHGSVTYTRVNEVWPNIFIGDDRETARNCYRLQKIGVTHVLNAAEGQRNSVCTGAGYYRHISVEYYGIEAEDTPSFNLSQHFFPVAEYMHQVLSNPSNKLLVHCVMGRSRSASLVLAYLMIHEKMTLVEAIEQVKCRRRILPNWGFLKQLRELDSFLVEQRKQPTQEIPNAGSTGTTDPTEML